MDTPGYTPLRHRMLAEVHLGEVALDCTNVKRAIWRPIWRHPRLGITENMTAAESRAANMVVWEPLGHTPYWQGDMDVLRVVELTDAGAALLSEWNAKHGNPLTPEES